jgi:hypothetical protein
MAKEKLLLIDNKWLLAEEQVESVSSMLTCVEVSDRSQVPSGVLDMSRDAVDRSSYLASQQVSMYSQNGGIELTFAGKEALYRNANYAHTKGVAEAQSDRNAEYYSWRSK